MNALNGWWWNPEEGGRGFFIERRGSHACVVCCSYAADGSPLWHSLGPVQAGARNEIAGMSEPMRLPGAERNGGRPLPLQISFEDESRARLQWDGVRIPIEAQHAELRRSAAEDFLTGLWIEDAGPRAGTLACEHAGKRVIATWLSSDGWLLLDLVRKGEGRYAGSCWRYEGGQSPGAPYRPPRGDEVPGGASLACDPDGTLRLRLPDAAECALRRLSFPAATADTPRDVEVRFSSSGMGKVSSGLVPLSFEIDGGRGYGDDPCRLTIEVRDAPLRFDKELRLGGWPRKLMLLLNSHLLPNAEVSLVACVTRGAMQLWSAPFTLSISNTGTLAEKVRASLRRSGAPLVIDGLADSRHFDFSDPELRAWFDAEGARERVAALRRVNAIGEEEERALRQFVEEGYMILPGRIEEPLLEKIDGELDDAIARKFEGYQYGTSQRLRNLHQRYPGIRALWRHPLVMRYLQLVFGVPARPCQTLTYVFGSQQDAHQDTVHLTPFPAGYMCGVWVALEDVRPDSGELEVFPRTHRLPRIYMQDAACPKVADDDWAEFGEKVVKRYRRMLDEGGFGKVTYRPKRGTVLVWHENLLHGGSVRIDTSLSRRSIVSHYFADGAIAFYDSTGLPGNME